MLFAKASYRTPSDTGTDGTDAAQIKRNNRALPTMTEGRAQYAGAIPPSSAGVMRLIRGCLADRPSGCRRGKARSQQHQRYEALPVTHGEYDRIVVHFATMRLHPYSAHPVEHQRRNRPKPDSRRIQFDRGGIIDV